MSRPDRHLRNMLGYALPELFWGFAWTIALDNPMPAAFAKGFEGSEGLVGTFMLCIAVGLVVPMLFTDYVVAPFRRKRTFLVWGHVVPAALVVLMGLGIHLVAELPLWITHAIYLGGAVVFFLTIGFQIPLWLGLVGDLFPHGMRARVLAIAFTCNRAGAVAGGFVAEWILDTGWSAHDQWTTLLTVAGAAMLIGTAPFLLIVEDPRVPRRRPTLSSYFGHMRATWRGLPALRRFVRADMLGVAVFVLLAFYGDAAIRAHGAHEAWAGRWLRTYSLAQIPVAILISVMGERVSNRSWLILGGLLAAGGGVAGAIVTEPVWFHLVAGLLGTYMLIRMTCHGPEVMRLSGGGDATIPIAISWALVVPLQGLLPFFAGEVLIPHPQIGYDAVFLAVACLSVVCVLLWARDRHAEPGNPDSSPSPPG